MLQVQCTVQCTSDGAAKVQRATQPTILAWRGKREAGTGNALILGNGRVGGLTRPAGAVTPDTLPYEGHARGTRHLAVGFLPANLPRLWFDFGVDFGSGATCDLSTSNCMRGRIEQHTHDNPSTFFKRYFLARQKLTQLFRNR